MSLSTDSQHTTEYINSTWVYKNNLNQNYLKWHCRSPFLTCTWLHPQWHSPWSRQTLTSSPKNRHPVPSQPYLLSNVGRPAQPLGKIKSCFKNKNQLHNILLIRAVCLDSGDHENSWMLVKCQMFLSNC